MIPLVATAPELQQMRAELEPVATEILDREGVTLDHLEWGTMIELPRAAVTAGEIAEGAEFFSFGTNDLTQTAFGFSRDDIGKFVGMYEERKLVPRTRSSRSTDRASASSCGPRSTPGRRRTPRSTSGSAASTEVTPRAWSSAMSSGSTT